MAFSDYLENKILGHVFGSTTLTKPAALYVGLYTGAPSDAAGGQEVTTSGTGYARKICTFTVSGTAPSIAANAADIEFPAATIAWGTITHAAVFDAVSGGNMLSWAALSDTKPIGATDVFRILATKLTISLD